MKRIEYLVYSRDLSHLERKNFEKVDRVIYYAVAPDKDGEIFGSEFEARLFEDKMYELGRLLSGYNDKQVYLGVGGLDELVGRRRRLDENNYGFNVFLRTVWDLVERHGFDGIDLNWEGKCEVSDYVYAVYCLGGPGNQEKRIPVSICIGYYQDNIDNYFEKARRSECEVVNIQCYGNLEENVRDYADFLRFVSDGLGELNIPKSKVNIGLPLYVSGDSVMHSWGWKHYVESGGNPCLNTGHFAGRPVGTNGLCTVAERVRQIERHGFNGIFTWDIALDFPYSSGVSIGRVIDENNAKSSTPANQQHPFYYRFKS